MNKEGIERTNKKQDCDAHVNKKIIVGPRMDTPQAYVRPSVSTARQCQPPIAA